MLPLKLLMQPWELIMLIILKLVLEQQQLQQHLRVAKAKLPLHKNQLLHQPILSKLRNIIHLLTKTNSNLKRAKNRQEIKKTRKTRVKITKNNQVKVNQLTAYELINI